MLFEDAFRLKAAVPGTAAPSGVVRMGNLNRFSVPSLKVTVHMIESVERKGTADAPMGTKSA